MVIVWCLSKQKSRPPQNLVLVTVGVEVGTMISVIYVKEDPESVGMTLFLLFLPLLPWTRG